MGRLVRIFGVALAVAIVAWQGFGVIADAFARAGFRLLVVVPYFAPSLVMAALARRTLLPPPASRGCDLKQDDLPAGAPGRARTKHESVKSSSEA